MRPSEALPKAQDAQLIVLFQFYPLCFLDRCYGKKTTKKAEAGRCDEIKRQISINSLKTNCLLIAVSILQVCLLTSRAQITPAFEPSGSPTFIHDTSHSDGGPVDLGMVFTPNNNITVNALGFYALSDVTGDEPVAIYDSGGNLVAENDATSADALTDGYFWVGITPVSLTAGNQYTVVAYTGDYDLDWAYGASPIVSSTITYEGQTYIYTEGLAFPTSTVDHAPTAYYGPNFSIGPSTSTFSGQVSCICDGSPVAGASVNLGQYAATTDGGGNYSISGIPWGTYTAIVSASNYVALTNTVTFASFVQTVTNNFGLSPLSSSAMMLNIIQSNNSFVISWPAPSICWVLQTNDDLTTTNWSIFNGPITSNDTGTTNSVIVVPASGNLFFRLMQ